MKQEQITTGSELVQGHQNEQEEMKHQERGSIVIKNKSSHSAYEKLKNMISDCVPVGSMKSDADYYLDELKSYIEVLEADNKRAVDIMNEIKKLALKGISPSLRTIYELARSFLIGNV